MGLRRIRNTVESSQVKGVGTFRSQRCLLHFAKLSNSHDQTIHEGLSVYNDFSTGSSRPYVARRYGFEEPDIATWMEPPSEGFVVGEELAVLSEFRADRIF